LGDKEVLYGPLTYMVTTVELPMSGQVVEASRSEPYLAIKMSVDPKEVADVVLTMGEDLPAKPDRCPCGMSSAQVDYGILDAMTRLARLLDTPTDARVLAPLIRREIIYRALTGEMGAWMRLFVKADSHAHRISKVIEELKIRFAEPLRVAELAARANMSESALYHTFKEVTRMSPVQYLKKLRLHEARRLMLTEGLEASTASYKVGYESPSHFSREYSRMFGAPPRADVMKLRGGERNSAAAVS
ncbi:MAG: AraC family transcriptional regulator, partial [Spongiibacteraceae bacterium]|nr:AraC family transcriptional regulator [Spongiibacteraceae bacterium]